MYGKIRDIYHLHNSYFDVSFFLQERVFFLTGIALGMAIHFKIYPIIFTLPLYSALSAFNGRTNDGDTIANYVRSLFEFNRARVRLVLGKYKYRRKFLMIIHLKDVFRGAIDTSEKYISLPPLGFIHLHPDWISTNTSWILYQCVIFHYRNLSYLRFFDGTLLWFIWMGLFRRVVSSPLDSSRHAAQLFSVFLYALPHCRRWWHWHQFTDISSPAFITACYCKGIENELRTSSLHLSLFIII